MNDPKQAILSAIAAELAKPENANATTWTIENARTFLRGISAQLGAKQRDEYLAIIVAWHELHRSGVLTYGYELLVHDRDDGHAHMFGTVHTTKLATKVIEHVRRDPSNPAGYLEHLDTAVPVGSVARSYLEEALATYSAQCDKATVVLVGCASEALIVELRNALAAKYVAPKQPPKGLDPKQWRMWFIIEGIHGVLTNAKGQLPNELGGLFEYRWKSVVDMIRVPRNEVGHPNSLTPVTRDGVHALLLIFTETAKLTRELIDWAHTTFAP